MFSPSFIAVRDDSYMSSPGPRAGGPTLRRSFTPAQKLAHLAAYDTAIKNYEGGAYLRTEGLYSSQITEWRKLRDAGVLAGKKPGEKIGRLTPEQAEIARLRRQLSKTEQRLETTGWRWRSCQKCTSYSKVFRRARGTKHRVRCRNDRVPRTGQPRDLHSRRGRPGRDPSSDRHPETTQSGGRAGAHSGEQDR